MVQALWKVRVVNPNWEIIEEEAWKPRTSGPNHLLDYHMIDFALQFSIYRFYGRFFNFSVWFGKEMNNYVVYGKWQGSTHVF